MIFIVGRKITHFIRFVVVLNLKLNLSSVQFVFIRDRKNFFLRLTMATEADNLDARMEAIRLKNEELEKKHREIMEDELNAKRENAVVNLKEMGKDIPKVHPYDNVELDFDVKDTEKELAKNPETAKPKSKSLSHHARIFALENFSCFLLVFIAHRSQTDATERISRRDTT